MLIIYINLKNTKLYKEGNKNYVYLHLTVEIIINILYSLYFFLYLDFSDRHIQSAVLHPPLL